MNYILSIDQSTSATKAVLFDEQGQLIRRTNIIHRQNYPKPGWVEHDAIEIYENTLEAIQQIINDTNDEHAHYSLSITNQRETVVVWDRNTGIPIYNAVVWQCQRGEEICNNLKTLGYTALIQEKSGLVIDPYFSASGVKWILDNVTGAREAADNGELMLGTIDSWLIYKLTDGKVHATDYTNASRTLLFNIHALDWDDELLKIFTIPRSMVPVACASDACYGETTANGIFKIPVSIAGVIGDSHGALVGQMCFEPGMGKSTYGTGSSVMVNIGEKAIQAPKGLVTSVGFSALGKIYYAFEGNIHCTGATIRWMVEKLKLIPDSAAVEKIGLTVADNGGVYLVPAFAGLGAPWWNPHAKAMISGMTLGTEVGHICRAAIESIAFQVKDLIDLMTGHAGIELKELRVDGGPTKNMMLMQFQADILNAIISRSVVEEASAKGAMIMNGLARGLWSDFETVSKLRIGDHKITSSMSEEHRKMLYEGWCDAIKTVNINLN